MTYNSGMVMVWLSCTRLLHQRAAYSTSRGKPRVRGIGCQAVVAADAEYC